MKKQIKRKQVVSKAGADLTFANQDGVRIAIEPGENNWLTEEELEFLQKNSKGFQHHLNLKKNGFKIPEGENTVRDETPEEKKNRLTLMERGKAAFKKIMPKKKAEADPEAPDTSAALEAFQNSIKTESKTALTQFKTDLENDSESVKKFQFSKLDISAEKLSKERDKEFSDKLSLKGAELLKSFSTSLETMYADKEKLFTEFLNTSVENKIKAFKKELKKETPAKK